MAFSEHRPLILSPDTIWLTVVQGFGQHILSHAEELRGRIVKHSGQALIRLITGTPIPWPDVIAQFSAAIKDHSDPILHETLLCDFSTITPEVRTAYQVALMDAYQRYFLFELAMGSSAIDEAECIDGIPQIALEGTTEDWRRMRERIEVLATYGLEWWTSRLSPILEEFAATASGIPDRAFWQAIYKPKETYDDDRVTGWIADLFPYFDDPRRSEQTPKYGWVPNHILESPRIDWLQSPSRQGGVVKESFPPGLSRAPLTLVSDGSTEQIELMAGFFGVSQHSAGKALSPIISWAAVEAANPSREPSESVGLR